MIVLSAVEPSCLNVIYNTFHKEQSQDFLPAEMKTLN